MCFIIVILLLFPVEVLADTAQLESQRAATSQDAALVAIRQDAFSTANRLIDELDEIEDLYARVAVAEKIVGLLYNVRPDRCRKMLNSIFDDAVAHKAQRLKSTSTSNPDSLIGWIIGAAARVDLG